MTNKTMEIKLKNIYKDEPSYEELIKSNKDLQDLLYIERAINLNSNTKSPKFKEGDYFTVSPKEDYISRIFADTVLCFIEEDRINPKNSLIVARRTERIIFEGKSKLILDKTLNCPLEFSTTQWNFYKYNCKNNDK